MQELRELVSVDGKLSRGESICLGYSPDDEQIDGVDHNVPRTAAARREIVRLLAAQAADSDGLEQSIVSNIGALVLSFAPKHYSSVEGFDDSLCTVIKHHQVAFAKAKDELKAYPDFRDKGGNGTSLSPKWRMRLSRYAKAHGLDNGKTRRPKDEKSKAAKLLEKAAVKVRSEKTSPKARKEAVERLEHATIDTLTIPTLTAIFESRPELVEELYRRVKDVLNG